MGELGGCYRYLLILAMLVSSACQRHEPAEPLKTRMVSLMDETRDLYQVILDQGVPEEPLKLSFEFFDENLHRIRNDDYMVIIDFNQHSGQRRFYLIDLRTGHVDHLHAAHGVNSDPDDDGYAQYFSNIVNSRQSSLGFYLTAERYWGINGLSMRLDGLQSTNNRARERAIVVHGADYVRPDLDKMGLSWGCPAVDHAWNPTVIERIENGALMLAVGTETPQDPVWLQRRILEFITNPLYFGLDESAAPQQK